MADEDPSKPAPPDLPAYLHEPLETQSPERLERVAAYAQALAAWKRGHRQHEAERRREAAEVDADDREALRQRGISTDPTEYEDVPTSGAYITIKEPKEGYRYYYWQWREGESWKNEYIAPVDPKQ